MSKILEGLVVNPRKKGKRGKKARARKNPTKVLSVMKSKRGGGLKKVGELIIKNPVRNKNALLMLAGGTAVGLAGGKLLDNYLISKVQALQSLNQHVPVGDTLMLLGGLALLKGSSKKNREFALGVVAGSGAKLVLNLLDRYIFKGNPPIGLYGEELADDEVIPAEYEEVIEENPEYALPEPEEVEGEGYVEEEPEYDELGFDDELEPEAVDVL
ncbi:MAG: hypothetical protein DSY42_09575 [Aquifex sp.]|nr:MAG: hypothetical protein DSY42_09575 [Aquifex sp.]